MNIRLTLSNTTNNNENFHIFGLHTVTTIPAGVEIDVLIKESVEDNDEKKEIEYYLTYPQFINQLAFRPMIAMFGNVKNHKDFDFGYCNYRTGEVDLFGWCMNKLFVLSNETDFRIHLKPYQSFEFNFSVQNKKRPDCELRFPETLK